MLSLYDLQDLISTSFFDGNIQIAGMVIYCFVLMILFGLTRKMQQTLILAIPVTLIFSAIGVLTIELMVLIIVITVLGLAFTARKMWSD